MRMLRAILADRTGGTAIEYGLVLCLVALAAVGSIQLFSNTLGNTLNYSGNAMATAPALAAKG